MNALTNPQWINRFEDYLKRRFPDRSTAKHYTSDLRLFVQHHPGPLTEIAPPPHRSGRTPSRPIGTPSASAGPASTEPRASARANRHSPCPVKAGLVATVSCHQDERSLAAATGPSCGGPHRRASTGIATEEPSTHIERQTGRQRMPAFMPPVRLPRAYHVRRH